MTLLAAYAARYAVAGWSVFPCRRDKKPLSTRGFKNATADPKTVRDYWARWPRASIGAAVPPVFAVLDVDGTRGEETLHALEAVHEQLPKTLTCQTGGGGWHHYFRHPGGGLRQGAGILGPGLDTRMPGKGYVILPPSPHVSGRVYAWVDAATPAAPMPPWLAVLLRPPSKTQRVCPHTVSAPDGYARRAIEGEVANLMAAPVGARNQVLHVAAVKLGGLVGAGVVGESDVVTALLQAARASGYTADDGERATQSTIASGLAWGRAHPRALLR